VSLFEPLKKAVMQTVSKETFFGLRKEKDLRKKGNFIKYSFVSVMQQH